MENENITSEELAADVVADYERRRAASQRAKQAGITPPKRSVSPKSE